MITSWEEDDAAIRREIEADAREAEELECTRCGTGLGGKRGEWVYNLETDLEEPYCLPCFEQLMDETEQG